MRDSALRQRQGERRGGSEQSRYQRAASVISAGDVNLSGAVDFADLLKLAQDYGATGATWDQGDLNYDGVVNFADLLLLSQNYGQGT